MTGQPAGQKVEIEFTAGVWTDVTADVDLQAGLQVRYGRSSEFSQPESASLNLQLDNRLGAYTPFRQVLADGVTAHPYYPNVVPRKRIRYSYTISATQYMRFVGYIDSWSASLENGVRRVMLIQASDLLNQLSRVVLDTPIVTEIGQDNPSRLWPLTDVAGSTSAAEQSTNVTRSLQPRYQGTAGGTYAFGGNGPGFGDGTGLNLAPTGTVGTNFSGYYLSGRDDFVPQFTSSTVWAYTIEIFFEPTVVPVHVTQSPLPLWSFNYNTLTSQFADQLLFDSSELSFGRHGGVYSAGGASGGMAANQWNHAVASYSSDGTGSATGGTWTTWSNGVLAAQVQDFPSAGNDSTRFNVGGLGTTAAGTSTFSGNIGYVAYYPYQFTTARALAHYQAAKGYFGDTTDQRIARWLTVAGIPTAQRNLDVGYAVVNTYPQGGQSVLQACQDMAVTESGGAAFSASKDGKARFTNRYFRAPAAPVMSFDAQVDVDGAAYQPSYDDLSLVNTVQVDRASESGTQTSQTAANVASVAMYGVSSATLTSYTKTDADALAVAQFEVAQQSTPGFRAAQLTVDLVTSPNTATLYPALGVTEIGSRIAVTNLPADIAPATTVPVFVEGWSESVTADTYDVTFDTSPADNPAGFVWDSGTYGALAAYGVWQATGNTLTSTITRTATSLSVTTAAGNATFSTAAGSYPLYITMDEEVLLVSAAPGSSTSPQTLTVTRAQQGTPAAAHTAGAVIDIWPTSGWTL